MHIKMMSRATRLVCGTSQWLSQMVFKKQVRWDIQTNKKLCSINSTVVQNTCCAYPAPLQTLVCMCTGRCPPALADSALRQFALVTNLQQEQWKATRETHVNYVNPQGWRLVLFNKVHSNGTLRTLPFSFLRLQLVVQLLCEHMLIFLCVHLILQQCGGPL